MKRSQMEIFGVIIIVMLLIFGLVFWIGSKIRKSDDDRGIGLGTDVSQRLLNAMFNSNSPSGLTLKDCIKDIADNGDSKCKTAGYEYSMTYTRAALEKMLSDTLGKWGRRYKLSVLTGPPGNYRRVRTSSMTSTTAEFIEIESPAGPGIDAGCGALEDKEAPGVLFIPAKDTIIVKLEICKI